MKRSTPPHPTSPLVMDRRRALGALGAGAAALATGLTLAPARAWADRDSVVRVQFVGWSSLNPDTYLLRMIDSDRGNRVEIRQVNNPKPTAVVPTTPRTINTVLGSEQFLQWDFDSTSVASGLTAPNGWVLRAKEQPGYTGIVLSNGKATRQLSAIPNKPDALGGYAKATLSTAYWTKDSSRVVVVINHLKGGSWGLDVDEAFGYKLGAATTPAAPAATP